MKTIRILAFTAVVAILQCVNPGSGSSTETARVTAMVYNPGGTPAKNATVRYCHHDNDPRPGHGSGVVDSTTTDSSGNYFIALDSAGTYTVTASSDSGLAYQDSVTAIRGDTVYPRPDTLKPAGTIRGIVRLENGGDPTTVFILFMGTRTFTYPNDTSGSFTSDSMAAGTYRVRILTTTPNYRTKDTVLNVTAGTVDSLPQPIVLKFTGIPTPSNVKISYDTLTQIVTLTWARPDTSLVKGYNVYRRDIDSSYGQTPINGTTMVRDTMYRDSTGIQDKTYEYKVVTIDKGDNAGKMSAGVSVVIASYFIVDSSFGTNGTGQGQFDYPSDIAIAANGDIYIVDKNNNRVQVFDSTMLYKRQFGNGILNRPNKISIDSLGQTFVAEYDTIFVFNATGVLVDTITAVQGIYDLDAKDSTLYVIIGGDSISLYSYDGTKKRGWQCSSFPSCDWVVKGDSSELFVSNGLELLQVIVYDTLGNNHSAVTLPYYPYSIAVDEIKHGLYTVCLDDIHGNVLHVTNSNNVEIANYKIPSQSAEPISIGLQQNGSVFLVLGTTNKILKLKILLP